MTAFAEDVEALVRRLAAALAAGGVTAGSRVATLLGDTPAAVSAIHAAWRIGAAVAPLNRRSADGELAAQLRLVEPVLLVHDEAHAERAARLAAELAGGLLAVERVAARWPSRIRIALPHLDMDAPAAIVATSGTTGRSRAAALRQRHLAASADAWAAVLSPRPADRWLLSLPLFHVAGLAILVRAARWGVELEVPASADAGALAAGIRAGASHLSLVPVQLEGLLAAMERPPATLRAVLLGGGPIPTGLLARAREAGLPVLTTYGLTETASGVAVGGAEPATLADPAALRPLPGVSLRIGGGPGPIEAEHDGSGREGEIEVAGGMIFEGYLGEAEPGWSTADGWLRTGDLGRLDRSGLLRVTGRLDDLIISGGENVQPAEVEQVLREHPDVLDAAVVARPDRAWGAVPVAAVVLRPGSSLDADALREHCRTRLAAFKVPAGVTQLPALPRNATGKLMRDEVRALLADPPR